jgi:2,5-dihydroxypyridine 5,6-dioxygenase
MPVGDTQLLKMFEHVLTLSGVNESQSVAVLKTSCSNPRLVWAGMESAQRLGAKVYGVELPLMNHTDAIGNDPTGYFGRTALTGHPAAQKALAAADLIIDTMLLLHSPEQTELLKNGTRMLLVIEPPEILARMLPTLEDKRRVEAAERRLRAAKTFVVKSRAGTDVEFRLGQYPTITEYGFADCPGRWDHWPSGFLFTWPNEGSANGVVVIDKGDVIFPFKTYVDSPIRLEIKDGYIRNIVGDVDAERFESYLRLFRDPEVFAISHIGWGLQDRAHWSALALYDRHESVGIDGRAYYGNFLFSTGPNTEAGGSRNTACHIDIPLRRCSVYLDGEPMVLDGDVIPAEQAVRGSKAAHSVRAAEFRG